MNKNHGAMWTCLALCLLPLLVLVNACSSDCFDANDPCPNDMISDESGCVWDSCAGEFTGNQIPCWFVEYDTTGSKLAGDQGQYVAYIRTKERLGIYPVGDVWIYDLDSGEHRQLAGEGRRCFAHRTNGGRVAWLDYVEFDSEANIRVTDVFVHDINTGQEWHVPNPDRTWTRSFSLAGDKIVVEEERDVQCGIFFGIQKDISMYDLGTEEKTLLVEGQVEEYNATSPRLAGDRMVYWRSTGACGDKRAELWLLDLSTGENRMIEDFTNIMPPPLATDYEFHFDGKWAVMWMGHQIGAYEVDTGRFVKVTECSISDCHTHYGDGLVVYDRWGIDDKDQRQLFAYDLESGQEIQLTHLRIFYDLAMPKSMAGNRLLWSEGRGKTRTDSCGSTREATGVTNLFFWKDLEF